MTVIHILARDIVQHDAVGNFCRQSALLLGRQGHDMRLWAENTDIDSPPYPVESRSLFRAALGPGDILFYHHSIHDPLLDEILALPNRKIGYFHNITPPDLIDPADAQTIRNCRMGLAQSGALAGFDLLLANSEFSAQALIAAMKPDEAVRWQARVIVCPPLVGADRWQAIASASPPKAASATLSMLYVGRLVPHKGVEGILALADQLAAELTSLSLVIVGGPGEGPHTEHLKARAAQILACRRSLQISFLHGISDEALKALYQSVDFALIHSQHEGFCIPALDALAFDKPIFTTPLPAVREVLGAASLEIVPNDPTLAAREILDFVQDEKRNLAHGHLRRHRFEEWRDLADGHILLEAVSSLGAN